MTSIIQTSNLRIGLFDSGVGGLTVLKQIYAQMPQESVIYFGDTERLPYGTKTPVEILQYVREIINWMLDQGVKMIIMACNTSSALALEKVQDEYDIPILGLILPGARAAVKQGKRIGVISTQATADSNAYRKAIQEINTNVRVWQVSCPEFVMLVEQNQIDSVHAYEIALKYLQPLIDANIDTLIYGCTHYRHLERVFKKILPSSINIVDPAEYLVIAANQELELMGLKSTQVNCSTRFCVSGSDREFAVTAQKLLSEVIQVEQVQVANSCLPGRDNL